MLIIKYSGIIFQWIISWCQRSSISSSTSTKTTISNRSLWCTFVVFPMLYRCLKIFFNYLPMDDQLVPEVFGSLQMIINNQRFVSNWSFFCIFVVFPCSQWTMYSILLIILQWSSNWSSLGARGLWKSSNHKE